VRQLHPEQVVQAAGKVITILSVVQNPLIVYQAAALSQHPPLQDRKIVNHLQYCNP
jgi:hypothetical protein